MKRTVGRALEDAVKGGGTGRQGQGSSMWSKSRESIFSFLTFRPFSTRTDIARAVGVSDKTVKWHLEKLMERGFVVCAEKRYLPTGFISKSDMRLFEVLSSTTARTLFLLIMEKPGITVGEAAVETGFSRTRVSLLTSEFKELGLVTRVKSGRLSHIYPTSLLHDKSEEYRKRIPAFIEHVTRLIRQEKISFDAVRREDTFTAVLREGGESYSLVLNINPITTLLTEA